MVLNLITTIMIYPEAEKHKT